MSRIALINPNTDDNVTATMVAIARACAPDGLKIEGFTAPFGVPLITSEPELDLAADAVAALAETLPPVDGVIVAAYGDPAVERLKAAMNVPVIGIAEASFAAAATFGRFAVATTTPNLAAAIARRAERLGYGENFAGVYLTEGDPIVLTPQRDLLVDALRQAVKAAKSQGARAVIIGGGPLAAAARALSAGLDIPIIEPIPAAVAEIARAFKR